MRNSVFSSELQAPREPLPAVASTWHSPVSRVAVLSMSAAAAILTLVIGTVESRGSVAENNPERQGADEHQVKLRTLAPEYDEEQHGIYVRHLEDAIQEKKNRNIALTGRYGSGKSSVLDFFEKQHKQSTLRISINTLGPDKDDEDLTNRIQKELVKQLVYRLKPGQIRRSRFARPKSLTRWRALLQALGVSTVGLSLLWLLGVRPAPEWPGATANPTAQAGLGLLFFALVVLAIWVVRWLIGDRIVSEVTTAGTKIALNDGPTSYFDSFLDEIVAFFDAVEPEYVIFEDLDRFDDPQIFDSLRELNTLINASAHWKKKERPLRFIYAIKDSLFEQLGAEAKPKDEKSHEAESGSVPVEARPQLDLAAAAVHRANRTKFFELVIPMVPFISHRNARDHLVNALLSLGFAEGFVSRQLLDLIARHTTDMRLMINICNEFAVFAEHLLWTENPAPGMTPDHLFALVAYKNFHLADFEAISQRTSTLDKLERHHRDQVRNLIEGLQKQRREWMSTEQQRLRKERTAAELGSRLRDIKDVFPAQSGWPYDSVTVDGQTYAFDVVDTVGFWERVAKTKSLSASQRRIGVTVTFTAAQLSRVFPEVIGSDQWLDPDATKLARLMQQYDDDIASLRGADFADLARYERVPKGQTGFDKCITDELKSELARDLVRRGFITRNYAEYSAIFYGNFVGIDVAFFYNHSVQPNEMYLDHQFTSENAMSNLLEQVPADFASSVSALNIQVASYLMRERPSDAKQLVASIVTHDSDDVRAFLEAFLNAADPSRELLVQQLATHPWRDVFEYLAGHTGIPDGDIRLRLFDAALLSALHVDAYEIGEFSEALLRSSYPRLTSVSAHQTTEQTDQIFSIMAAADVFVADLQDLSEQLRSRVVAAHMYEITAPNLRLALGIDDAPSLDEVRRKPDVWKYCQTRIEDYIQALQADASFEHLVLSEATLVDVINEECESWTDDQLRVVIRGGAPSAAIREIRDVPQLIWPAVVEADMMAPTAANVSVYAQVHGVDEALCGFLAPPGADLTQLQSVDDLDVRARDGLAVSLLNASTHLTAQTRVQLVGQLDLESDLDPSDVTPGPDQLLARALEAKLLPDDRETFAHFAQGGWRAVSEAFVVSEKVSEYMAPALVDGFAADFLESPQIPDGLRRIVVEDISGYVPADDGRALRAAGRFASANRIWLPLDDVRRIARVTRTPDAVLPQLVHAKATSPNDLADILAELGDPYDKLAGGPGTEFDLPNGSSNETLFKRLEAAGRIKIVPKSFGRGRKVHNLA